MKNRLFSRAHIIKLLALLALAVLYVAGLNRQHKMMENLVSDSFPEMKGQVPLHAEPLIYKIDNTDSTDSYYRVFSSGRGWGGPFTIVIEADQDAVIMQIEILKHCETPSYITKLDNSNFFIQFNEMETASAFELNNDIDGVSGATISSRGFSDAIRNGCHTLCSDIFGKSYRTGSGSFSIGFKEISILLLFILTYIGSRYKLKKLRYITLFGGMILIGFLYNIPVSISQFSSIFLGFIPNPLINICWWLILGGALLLIIFSGRNLYCGWICPFGAVQELISKMSGFKLPLHPKILKYGPKVLYVLTFISVGMMFYFRNTSFSNYEPFAALFKFDGYGLIWFIMPAVFFSSFFWKRFYCRFFCPAGLALNMSAKLRRNVKCRAKSEPKAKKRLKNDKTNQGIASLIFYIMICLVILAFLLL